LWTNIQAVKTAEDPGPRLIRKFLQATTPFGLDLRVLAVICIHVVRAQICTQVNTKFNRLATQCKSTQVGFSVVFFSAGAGARLH